MIIEVCMWTYIPQLVDPVSKKLAWCLNKQQDSLLIPWSHLHMKTSGFQILEQGNELLCGRIVIYFHSQYASYGTAMSGEIPISLKS